MLGINPKVARYAWSALALPAVGAMIFLLRRTLFVFAISLMFAYLLYPLADRIERRFSGRSRTLALALPFLLILTFTGMFGVFLGHHAGAEASQLIAKSKSQDFVARVKGWDPLGMPIGEQIANNAANLIATVPQLGLGKRLVSASQGLLDFFVIPILSFLILKDGSRIRHAFLEMLGANWLVAEGILIDAHRLMVQYMRALLILCLTTLITSGLGLSLLGAHYSILLASIASVLEFVPMAGPLTAAVVIVSVNHFSGYSHPLWWLVAFLAVYRLFLDYAVAPQLMRRGMELHPLLVLFGVFAGAEIGGVAGVFLSVPVLALSRLLYCELRKRRPVSSDLHLDALFSGGQVIAQKQCA